MAVDWVWGEGWGSAGRFGSIAAIAGESGAGLALGSMSAAMSPPVALASGVPTEG